MHTDEVIFVAPPYRLAPCNIGVEICLVFFICKLNVKLLASEI